MPKCDSVQTSSERLPILYTPVVAENIHLTEQLTSRAGIVLRNTIAEQLWIPASSLSQRLLYCDVALHSLVEQTTFVRSNPTQFV